MKRLFTILVGTMFTFVVMWYVTAYNADFANLIVNVCDTLDITDQGIITFMLVVSCAYSCIIYTIEQILEELMFATIIWINKTYNRIKSNVSKKAAAK